MTNILNVIVNYKRELIANSQDVTPTTNSQRDFKAALMKSDFGFIMECKKASPSKGLIREDFDLSEIVPIYNRYADAISVLTEERFFQGSYKNLEYVSEHTDKPVLCKDFILTPKQVRQARFYGADAVLLMLSILSDSEYMLCQQEAAKYQMDVLTEVHDESELQRAIALGSDIIGINNRDLKTLKTSLNHTKTLFSLVPKDRVIITESGINDHSDIIEMSQFADACLVGSSLMQHADLNQAASKLVYGDIKICGVTSQIDLNVSEQTEASHLGIIFSEKSKRKVTVPLVSKSKPLIGVFQNQPLDFVLKQVSDYQLNGVQLHGSEDKPYIEDLREKLGRTFFISKVTHVTGSIDELCFENLDEVLLDTQIKGQQGGTGKAFDWSLLSQHQIQSNKHKIRVAGGLNSSNIREIKKKGFYKLDVCSGSESSPGIKCPDKLNNIFANSKLKGLVR
ncbi:MAG: bifunctional indole-3-glycerol-phosphate synthase TrpC/phosphoribosylanthranilate isomerase TrpF [Gammaproteobacteria bacterium]|nr:bifunctional indole-3-glycerol-phosphate synthase TrpC/phosphoribosylanthranilate isomerase TrpF [Gammaproteobacteria bacterium]